MSTTGKKKKVIKKKVVKKVVKKKKVASNTNSPISNGVHMYSPIKKNIHSNGHTKMQSIPRGISRNRTHRPSIEDAITRFTSLINEQTEIIDKLKQENQKLKKEIEELKNRPPEKIYIRGVKPKTGPPHRALPNIKTHPTNSPLSAKSLSPPTIKQMKSSPIHVTPPPSNTNNNSGVITNISKDDAKNALAGLFGAKSKVKTPTNTNNNNDGDGGGVITNISKDDAKNALAGLFGARKNPMQKAKSAMVLPTAKYDDDDDGKINLEIATPLRLVKYVKLGKIMPVHVVENRMKMDGITKILIGQLTKQWMKAVIPDDVTVIDRDAAPPPPMTKEFNDLIEKKEDGMDGDDDLYEKLKLLGLRPKKRVKPSRKMKRFHWKKIEPEAIPSTLWMNIDDECIQFNKVEFELKFQFRTPRPSTKKTTSKKDRTGQIYTFVLPKRSQNVQIALSILKMENEILKTAVIEMDEKVFDIDTIEKFIEIAPNEDEQREAEMHAMKQDVDPSYFGRSEKFFYSFVDIVDLSIRLKLWLFMMNFKEMVSDKQSQIYSLQSGCRALSECISFKNILTILLAFGNHMNGGSHAGQAYGFEIDSLSLLPGIKTMDTSMNLMMYLYKTLYEKFPDYLNVMTDLKAIKLCSTMDTELLDKSITEIKEKFDLLKSTLTRFEEDYLEVLPIEDRFIQHTKQWIKTNKKHLTKLIMMHKRTKNKCKQLGALFNWNLEENRIETLFSICNQFISDLYKARDDIHKLEIEREKRRKKRERNKKKQIAKDQHKKKLQGVQKHKRSIMDDVRNRKRKNTAILEKVGAKLTKSLVEKSKLIEATNYKKQLPETFKNNKIKRKMSSVYNKQVERVKPVPKGRMRLPTIVSKKGLPDLPPLKQVDETKNNNKNKKRMNKKRSNVQKRKRTKGWFKKGKEPKPQPMIIRNAPKGAKGVYAQPNMSYNPLAEYETNYKTAYRRGRGISNNKDDIKKMEGNRWRSDTPTNPTALTGISSNDLKKGQNVAKQWQQAHHPHAVAPISVPNNYNKKSGKNPHKRAASMKMASRRLNRAAYSPPNMGIVRLNKLKLNGNKPNNMLLNGKKKNLNIAPNIGKKKSSADLNLPHALADEGDEFLLLESVSPATSPGPRKKSHHEYQFAEENNWD